MNLSTAVNTGFIVILLLVTGCEQEPQVHSSRFLAFGTLVDLTVSGVSADQAAQATSILEKDFQRMHHSWHAWDPGPLGRVNRLIKAGGTFSVPPSVMPLIKKGQLLSQQSDGLFNPAIGALIDAWGFHQDAPDGHRPPTAGYIAQFLRDNPRMSDLKLEGITLASSNPAVKLDFGAFGKGYGIDLAVDHLQELGIDNAIMNAGGDLRAIGSRIDRPWQIAIRHPSGQGILATLQTTRNESIFTSGDYERNFTWKGKRYHHIIDPRTGYPASGTKSVTVIHRDATVADAAATALFIAGPELWQKIARQMGIQHVLLVDAEGKLHMTPAMQKRVVLAEGPHQILLSPALESELENGRRKDQ